MAERVTNNMIFEEIGKVKEIATATRDQAMRTNGRVTKLENWQSGVVAVEVSRQNRRPTDGSTDYTKIILVTLGLLGTALSVITVLVNK